MGQPGHGVRWGPTPKCHPIRTGIRWDPTPKVWGSRTARLRGCPPHPPRAPRCPPPPPRSPSPKLDVSSSVSELLFRDPTVALSSRAISDVPITCTDRWWLPAGGGGDGRGDPSPS